METQKSLNSQSNLGKEEQSRRHHNSGLQVISQSYSNQNGVVQAQKWTHRSMEQSRKPRNEPTMTGSRNLRQSRKHPVLGKLGGNMQKKEIGPLSYTIHKGKFKMD